MAITFGDIIVEALGHIGVNQQDPMDASDLQTAFFTACAMADGWGIEPLTYYDSIVYAQFTTQAGKQAYNVGVAGAGIDWAVPALPPDISGIGMMFGSLERALVERTAAWWRALGLKSMQTGIVTDFWPNTGVASHQLNFWPVPNATIPMVLYVPQGVAVPTSTATAAAFPRGYQEPFTFELAIKLSGKFGGVIPPWLPAALLDGKEKIRGKNFPILDARCDDALLSKGGRTGGGSISFYEGK